MTVSELIRRLERMPPDAEVALSVAVGPVPSHVDADFGCARTERVEDVRLDGGFVDVSGDMTWPEPD